MGQSVACVVDVASRAAELSGDAFELSVQTEEHDGVRYVRLVTDPASMVMPLSAFRYVAAWAGLEPGWHPMDDAPKDGTVVMYIYKIDGAFGVSTMQWMQTWLPSDESSPCWWDMQLDDEAYKPLGWMLGPILREPNCPPQAALEESKDG